MLSELFIKNFAIIDNLKVSFEKELNILTGETGAGKSIIIDALMFVLGCRASQDFIRSGAEQTEVEALFEINDKHPVFSYLSEAGIDCADNRTLILKRVFSQKGKNSIFINNQRCTLSILSGAGEQIVDIHGQNSHQQILKEEFQLEVLDSYGNLLKDRSEIKELFEKLASLKQQSGKLASTINEINSRKELLEFQTDEIEKAHPDVFNLLLQVMDHGTLTDNNGRKADFRNVILVMTTNAGADQISRPSIGFTHQDHSKDSSEVIKKTFTPEFRNRLDAMIQFKALTPETIQYVVDKFIIELETQLEDKNVTIQVEPNAKQWLAENGFDPVMGARPMSRVIQENIKKNLARSEEHTSELQSH